MKFSTALTALATALLATSAQAGVLHVYDVIYDGSGVTYNQNAAGETLAAGDQVRFTLHASGGYWSFAGGALWAPIDMAECGTRNGDLTMNLLAGASTIATGGYLGQDHRCVHIQNGTSFAGPVAFDGFSWLYTENSFTPDPGSPSSDTLGGVFNASSIFLNWNGGTPEFIRGSLPGHVPEPASVLLVGAALLAAARRRAR
jgi:hypothetical protein